MEFFTENRSFFSYTSLWFKSASLESACTSLVCVAVFHLSIHRAFPEILIIFILVEILTVTLLYNI